MRGAGWIWILAALAGCGYVVGAEATQERTAAGDLPRVAVLPFDNATFRRGLEMRLTRLVADELRARSPRSAWSASEADWLIEGTIVRADERVFSEDLADVVRESSFVISVRVRLKDRATGKILRTGGPFTEREPFSARAGRVATLGQAKEEALRDLAESIVYWLEAGQVEASS